MSAALEFPKGRDAVTCRLDGGRSIASQRAHQVFSGLVLAVDQRPQVFAMWIPPHGFLEFS